MSPKFSANHGTINSVKTGYETGLYSNLTALLSIFFALNSFRFLKHNFTSLNRRLNEVFLVKFFPVNFWFNLIFTTWIVTNFILILGLNIIITILVSLFQTLFVYYFVVSSRHSHIFRGFGAPGHFQLTLSFSNLIFACSSLISIDLVGKISDLLVMELGMIFIVSGIYKFFSGYRKWRGIEVGLYNSLWSRWPQFWIKSKQKKFYIPIMNSVSIWGEIIGGSLLMFPRYNYLGSLIIGLMFAFVFINIKLGALVPTIIVTVFSPQISTLYSRTDFELENQFIFQSVVTYLGYAIILLSFLNYLILNFNFYSQRKLASNLIQSISNYWTKASGQCLWRVFTSDITSIHITIHNEESISFKSEYEGKPFSRKSCVLESITLVSIFTSLKYVLGVNEFEKRLEKYAATHKYRDGMKIEVSYIDSRKNYYNLIPVMEIAFTAKSLYVTRFEGFDLICHADSTSRVFKGKALGVYAK